jgi:hypothetical protein
MQSLSARATRECRKVGRTAGISHALRGMVGGRGFEPRTSCAEGRRLELAKHRILNAAKSLRSIHCSGICSERSAFFDRLYYPSNAKSFQLPGCDFLLFLSRMNVPHRHLNAGMPQHRGERWKVNPSGYCPRCKRVAKIVKPKVLSDKTMMWERVYSISPPRPTTLTLRE